ncbi:metalloregulator ArsR/SmtB family transcription factor [Endozoicomonas sp. SM1973]|uniref:Metalloregulator ArsR/SmtB family transcription factor n=1 Tax=Spartinivicinus marinus TaxID=2994442 RepID=A0A853IEG1_9GAMM|nr:metalloregulator ArsR/SmtB family transcription factor [Spartinivicinus marinus]MCX4027342.1 metalloregulator ArsR/SmtB family transcription factor [Spartinivicinus marinus]NYZ68434.1 metalloregulator ArsR/SmtB family transcription factor [Spartinivicinus marinus]
MTTNSLSQDSIAPTPDQALVSSETLASFCKASADPLRLDILRALKADSFGVLELCAILDIKQSALSHHLKIMAKAGLVTTRREGNTIFYRREWPKPDQATAQLLTTLYKTVDLLPISAATQERLQQVKQQRAETARAFFAKFADKFRQQQELIAEYDIYAASIKEVLTTLAIPKNSTAIEIGPGEGLFLNVLSPLYKQVIAVDISQEMLEKAKLFADEQQLNNIQFIHQEAVEALATPLTANCIVMNMVLHHVPSPTELFIKASEVLIPGGSLLISDLCAHDQSWVQQACGDMWLGFAEDEVNGWVQQTDLEPQESLYLGLRNGFQLQVRHFIKPASNITN